jgi:hypothetical protein
MKVIEEKAIKANKIQEEERPSQSKNVNNG